MEKDPLVYLAHIQECINKIKEYTKGIDEGFFLENTMIQDAVIRNFEIIGEATKQLPQDFRAQHPGIEWRRIAGMRDKLIQNYIGVDLWAVWGVVDSIIPDLSQQIDEILKINRTDS